MPFDSRKQQQWYHATGQTYLDDEPESAKKVKEVEDPEYKDLTTTAGGDLDPYNKNLQTTQGSMRESVEFEKENYILSPEGHIPIDDDLEYEDNIYVKEVTEEEKSLKRDNVSRADSNPTMTFVKPDELASEYTYKEMRESLLKNDIKQIITKAVEDFKEEEHPREEGGKFTSGGDSGGKTEAPKEDKPKEKRFTMSSYKRNEGRNAHAANALNLVKQYGTPEEIKEIEEINARHKKENRLGMDDYNRRYEISNKYYSKLVKEAGEAYLTPEEWWNSLSSQEKRDEFEVWAINYYDKESTWQRYNYGDAPLSQLPPPFQNRVEGKAREVKGNEEGIASVSGPPADSTMRVMSDKVYVRKDEESLTDVTLTDTTLTDTVLGDTKANEDGNWIEPEEKAKAEYEKWKKAGDKPISDFDFDLEYEGEVYTLSQRGYNPTNKDLIFEGKIYKAQEGEQYVCDTCGNKSGTEEQAKQHMAENEFREGHNRFTKKATEGIGNCQFCAGKGQVTVENLGIKDCPDCDGTGEIKQPNPAPDITGQMDPTLQPQQPTQEVPQQEPQPDQPTQQDQIPQQAQPNEQPAPLQQAPEENQFPPQEKPKFGEAKLKAGYIKCPHCEQQFSSAQWALDHMKEEHGVTEADIEFRDSKGTPICPFCDYNPTSGEDYRSHMEANHKWSGGLGQSETGESKPKVIACEKSMKQFRGYIAREIGVLKKRAKANEAVSIMYGLPTISKQGKKIKGILAYAGVSLNDRIYLPEELSKGHGLTLPLLLNHSNIAGAEEELDRLDDDMVSHLEDERDYKIGEVTLDWDQEKLTLFYEGVIEHEFFQKEVDDADMAVSLGIYYDSDSPVVCDVNCYTIIKGAEFREVSLVYHPGFPIATIEAVEAQLKKEIREKQKANEDHLEKLVQLKKNEEEEQARGEDETEDIKLIDDIIEAEKKEGEENEEDIIITDDPETLNLVTQVPAEDWNEETIATESNFSVRGINGFTISNSNGVTRYKLDPSNGYENNWLHVNVNQSGAKLFGENFQLQPKMTTPPELTKEIEKHPDIKFTDSDADAFKKKLKA